MSELFASMVGLNLSVSKKATQITQNLFWLCPGRSDSQKRSQSFQPVEIRRLSTIVTVVVWVEHFIRKVNLAYHSNCIVFRAAKLTFSHVQVKLSARCASGKGL